MTKYVLSIDFDTHEKLKELRDILKTIDANNMPDWMTVEWLDELNELLTEMLWWSHGYTYAKNELKKSNKQD